MSGLLTVMFHPIFAGGAPNISVPSFYVFEPGRVATFAFHDCCLEILTKATTGLEDAGNIDKDVLYNAMASLSLSEGSATCLDLDYGDFLGRDQCWESIPGEEVCCPEEC